MQDRGLGYIVSIISRQFDINADKDIFSVNSELCFSKEMLQSITEERQLWRHFSIDYRENLTEYLVRKFLKSFYNVNQYLNFEVSDYIEIRKLYNELFVDICDEKNTALEIELNHYARCRTLVARLQPILYDKCKNGGMNRYVCSEYSALFQLSLLDIMPSKLREPILDIGCGEHGYLVHELRQQGIDAYGMDRLCATGNGLTQCSWFDYDFGDKKWGTILSNLSFSSHFINHMIGNSSDVPRFYKVYNNVLNSLLMGGTWHYAPALPQLEATLPTGFVATHSKIDDIFAKTAIQRKGH